MAIQQTIESPYSTANVDSLAYNARFTLDVDRQVIGLFVNRYADRASHDAGKPPIESIPVLIEGAAFGEHVAANADAYAAVKAAVEAYLLTLPQFAGGTIVD